MNKYALVIFVFVLGCKSQPQSSTASPLPALPTVAQKPHVHQKFGDKRQDPYFWLRERENPQVLEYLRSENAYADAVLAPSSALQEKLYTEMRRRIKETDQTFPAKDGDYYYYSRTEEGKEYKIFCRKLGAQGKEHVLLDVNEAAKGHSFFAVDAVAPSPNQQLLAYAVDTVGRRFYTIYFLDLKTGKLLPDKIENTTGNFEWANDNQTLYYGTQNPKTLRWDKVYSYRVGANEKANLVYFEKDETFYVGIDKSMDDRYITISSGSTLSNEVRIIDADHAGSEPRVFLAREPAHEYSVMSGHGIFYILTNWKAKNFRLMKTPDRWASARAGAALTTKSDWQEVIATSSTSLIENAMVFQNFVALLEREKGQNYLSILDRASNQSRRVAMPDPIYGVSFGTNLEYATQQFRFDYESLNTPPSVYDLEFKTRQMILRKRLEVPGLNPAAYESKRLWAPSHDGKLVPLSVLMKRGVQLNGQNPLLLYGYGSYGYSLDPDFNRDIFSLIDRGYIFVIAHIRGGSEMGRAWYEDGRQLKKKNTFLDFIAAAEYLVQNKYTSPEHLAIQGGSAGGLLIGATINMRPDLFHAAVAQVPFVDVVTTMLDDSIPLTTAEYDEWGNPNKKPFYEYIKSYSPYDNVRSVTYPHLLVLTGLHDSQVQYWEPAKWVSRLRENKSSPNLVLLKTEMEEGHGGKTGRFQRLKDKAVVFAFLLMAERKEFARRAH